MSSYCQHATLSSSPSDKEVHKLSTYASAEFSCAAVLLAGLGILHQVQDYALLNEGDRNLDTTRHFKWKKCLGFDTAG